MNYDNNYINNLIETEISFSNNLALKYNYPDNITHLLYVIIPAFILKYGNSNKKLIEECFSNVPILINDKQDKLYQAYYFSNPKYVNNDKGFTGTILSDFPREYIDKINTICNNAKS